MAEEGWIKLYRSIRSNWLWEDGNERYLKWWLDILLMVNHKPNKALIKGNLVDVETGERVTSLVKLSERWGADRKVVRKFLNLLETDGMISRSSSTKNGTRLKVTNYADYQGFKSEKEQVTPHVTPQVSPHKQELKEVTNNVDLDFEDFFDYFNKKTGRSFKNIESNRKLVRARLNDGFTKKDLKMVIDYKCAEWKNNESMHKYLRPNTLFAPSHFNDYLNEAKEYVTNSKTKTTSDGQRKGKTIEEIEAERDKHLKEIEERAKEKLNEH